MQSPAALLPLLHTPDVSARGHRIALILALLTVSLSFFPDCGKSRTKANQVTPLVSPSGAYVLKMPIEKVGRYNYWRLEIRDTASNLLYKDKEGFPARFNVYWCWDSTDIVWLYNSDDGKVYFFSPQRVTSKTPYSVGEPERISWSKNFWGSARKNECGLSVTPPPSLYPDYVK